MRNEHLLIRRNLLKLAAKVEFLNFSFKSSFVSVNTIEKLNFICISAPPNHIKKIFYNILYLSYLFITLLDKKQNCLCVS